MHGQSHTCALKHTVYDRTIGDAVHAAVPCLFCSQFLQDSTHTLSLTNAVVGNVQMPEWHYQLGEQGETASTRYE